METTLGQPLIDLCNDHDNNLHKGATWLDKIYPWMSRNQHWYSKIGIHSLSQCNDSNCKEQLHHHP